LSRLLKTSQISDAVSIQRHAFSTVAQLTNKKGISIAASAHLTPRRGCLYFKCLQAI